MPNLVDVPENAVREEPLAFGLTAPQLLVCGIAVVIGAVIQLLPLWLPLQIVLMLLLAGPVLVAAVMPIRGEPAYRWLIRWVRFVRGPRTWQVSAGGEGSKSQISEVGQDAVVVTEGEDMHGDNRGLASGDVQPADESIRPAPDPGPVSGPVRLRVVEPDEDERAPEGVDAWDATADRPVAIPHVLPTMRVVAMAGFAGGTGRTTIAAEVATLVGSHARIRGLDGAESAVLVLLLDAARLTSAVGLRLGL